MFEGKYLTRINASIWPLQYACIATIEAKGKSGAAGLHEVCGTLTWHTFLKTYMFHILYSSIYIQNKIIFKTYSLIINVNVIRNLSNHMGVDVLQAPRCSCRRYIVSNEVDRGYIQWKPYRWRELERRTNWMAWVRHSSLPTRWKVKYVPIQLTKLCHMQKCYLI